MFHRVLPEQERIRLRADPTYSVTPEFLAACIGFLRSNYEIVGLDEVLQSRRGNRALPPWPALITFDDGWSDNLTWGLPILRGTPWTLFVAADAVTDPNAWWQEALLREFRSGRASYEDLCRLAGEGDVQSAGIHETDSPELNLILRFGRLPPERRRAALAAFEPAAERQRDSREMLTTSEVAQLNSSGVSIGAHGSTHLPLTFVNDPETDMRQSRDWLAGVLGAASITSMSFPHGRWDAGLADTARRLGYELLFTSDATLNRCPGGWLCSEIIGRIGVATHDIADRRGRMAPPRLARWLYRRDRQTITA
jgi:peptidoglycan/xylan/chitin deacetylase (PgdA/CDA1 family)